MQPKRVSIRQLARIYRVSTTSLRGMRDRHRMTHADLECPHKLLCRIEESPKSNRGPLLKMLEFYSYRHAVSREIAKLKFPSNPEKWT
jgi:hypothetical protein